MKRSVKFALATLIVTFVATSSFAVTVASTNTNNVTATVVGSCQWTTASLNMGFGNYDPFNAVATTGVFNINFKCVKSTVAGDTYKIFFSKTAGNMINGANNLAYTLTDNSNNPLPVTSGTAIAPNAGGVAGVAGAGYTLTIKGSVAASQDVPVGAYSDTVVANIFY